MDFVDFSRFSKIYHAPPIRYGIFDLFAHFVVRTRKTGSHQGGLKGIPTMLCGQQVVKRVYQGARRVGFAGYLARFQSKILYTYGHWGTLSSL